MKEVEVGLRQRVSSLINGMGYEFIGCEWCRPEGERVLRVYIDSPKGITVDDCAKVSHQMSAMLDVDDSISGRYVLEISSPGVDRPLFDIGHYQKQVGQRVKLSLRIPVNNRRRWTGILARVENEQIYLLADTGEIMVPFLNIEKANVIANIK